MYYVDLTSFMLGVLTGVAGTGIFVGFAATLVVYHASETDKRGLAARVGRRGLAELGSEEPPATLPVSGPQLSPTEQLLALTDQLLPPPGDSGLGQTTAPTQASRRPGVRRSKRFLPHL